MTASVSAVTGAEARLCTKGSRAVRIMWMTSVWVHMEATNQPVWNRAMKASCASGASCAENSRPPVAAGQKTKYITRKVATSNTELTGPFHSMNRPTPRASQRQGERRYSGST